MARALSGDLWSRVIAAVEGGMSRRGAAERFGVGVATAIRWLRDWRTQGRASARPKGGALRSRCIEAFAAVILGTVEAKVDITLVELAAMLGREHGATFAPSTVWRLLDRHRSTRKKSRPRCRAGQARGRPTQAHLVRRPA